MTKTAFAIADTLTYPQMIAGPHVFVSLNGPRGGNQGSAGISAEEARSLAAKLITGAAEVDGKPCEIVRLKPFEIAALGVAVGYGDSFTTDWVENEGASEPDALKAAADVELAEQIVGRIEAAHGAIAASPVTAILAELQRRRDVWAGLSTTVDGQNDLDEDEGEVLATEYDELVAFVSGLAPPPEQGRQELLAEAATLHNSADLTPCYTPPDELPERFFRVRFYKEEATVDRFSITVRENGPEEARQRVRAWGEGNIELTDEEAESEHYERQADTLACEFSALEEADDPYAAVECDADGQDIAKAA